jgi:hypothetical protein
MLISVMSQEIKATNATPSKESRPLVLTVTTTIKNNCVITDTQKEPASFLKVYKNAQKPRKTARRTATDLDLADCV